MNQRYTVNQIEKDINRKLHSGGTSLTQDFFGALDEGRRNMITTIEPKELQRVIKVEDALYDQVDRYAVPNDLNYDNIIEIKSLSGDRNVDTFQHPLEYVYRRRFDQRRKHSKNIYTIEYDSGIKYIKIYRPEGLKTHTQTVVTDVNGLTDNGTWNTGGNLVNLQLDDLNFITGKHSLRFDFNDSGTTGFLENFTLKSVNILDYMRVGSIFTWFNLPVFSIVTSIKLTLGSSLTDYFTVTVNQPHDNNQFTSGWNLLKFSLNNPVMVGNPNPKAITYIRFDFSTTGQPMAACNADNVVARKGKVYEITYQSAYCFIDPLNLEFKQFATENTDFISLEESAYQILMLETAKAILQEAYGNANRSNDDIVKIEADIKDAYTKYIKSHKQDAIDPFQTGYIFGNEYDGYTDESLADNVDNSGKFFGSW